jgi:hypothetical protein
MIYSKGKKAMRPIWPSWPFQSRQKDKNCGNAAMVHSRLNTEKSKTHCHWWKPKRSNHYKFRKAFRKWNWRSEKEWVVGVDGCTCSTQDSTAVVNWYKIPGVCWPRQHLTGDQIWKLGVNVKRQRTVTKWF